MIEALWFPLQFINPAAVVETYTVRITPIQANSPSLRDASSHSMIALLEEEVEEEGFNRVT